MATVHVGANADPHPSIILVPPEGWPALSYACATSVMQKPPSREVASLRVRRALPPGTSGGAVSPSQSRRGGTQAPPRIGAAPSLEHGEAQPGR